MSFVKSNFTVSLAELQLESTSTPEKDEVKGFRPICLKCGVFDGSRGSAYGEFGNTRVLAQVHGPKEDGGGDFHSGSVLITLKGCEEEKLRAQLKSSLSGVIQLSKYAKSQIEIEISVLSSDGGVLQTALIVSALALVHSGIEVLDVLVAASVSVSSAGDFSVDPAGTSPKGVGYLTMALMPNLNQVVCCDVQGALSSRTVNDAISFGMDQAVRLYPVVRQSILSSITNN